MTTKRLGTSMAILGGVLLMSWPVTAGDRFSKLADAKGLILISPKTAQKCGAITLPRIKTKVGRLLLWEIRNSCATYPATSYPIEIKNFYYQGANCPKTPDAFTTDKPLNPFDCTSITASLVWGTPSAFAGCVVKKDASVGCYKYDIWIEGALAVDPELEIAN